jgi:hypothetical protein
MAHMQNIVSLIRIGRRVHREMERGREQHRNHADRQKRAVELCGAGHEALFGIPGAAGKDYRR